MSIEESVLRLMNDIAALDQKLNSNELSPTGEDYNRLHGLVMRKLQGFVKLEDNKINNRSNGGNPDMFNVSWSVDVEIMGDHKDAAQEVANLYFNSSIAAGEYDSACSFVVTADSDQVPVDIDLVDSLSDLDTP